MPSESLREWAPLIPGGELNSDILCEAAVTKLANGSVFFKPGGGWVLFQLAVKPLLLVEKETYDKCTCTERVVTPGGCVVGCLVDRR